MDLERTLCAAIARFGVLKKPIQNRELLDTAKANWRSIE